MQRFVQRWRLSRSAVRAARMTWSMCPGRPRPRSVWPHDQPMSFMLPGGVQRHDCSDLEAVREVGISESQETAVRRRDDCRCYEHGVAALGAGTVRQ